MAQIRYRGNLSAKDFVYSSQQWGRSVVMKQYDQNFSRQIVSPTDPDKDIGIPQIFYGHNIMPSAQGFQSVGFTNPAIGPNSGVAYQVVPYTNVSNNASGLLLFLLGGSNSYNVYALPRGSVTWTLITTISSVVNYGLLLISTANVAGQTYILVPNTNCYTFDGTTLSIVTLTGITVSNLIGITESFGYMIAWSGTAVAWSSTLSPTDFTPSLITGAGGGSVTALSGDINICAHHTFGFIVFSNYNCVAAVYSGNSRFPFNFREIIGGGGVHGNLPLIDLDSESGNLYAWTTAGLQIVSVTQAQVVFPELSNFINGSRFEDFNDATLQFIETDILMGAMLKQLKVIAQRYLVISYGVTSYTHALIYDISMKRWGKIKINHVQAFDWFDNATEDQRSRVSLAFLDSIGGIHLVDFSYTAATGGTIILGKYQHARDRWITLEQVDLEFIQDATKLTVNVVPTYDGKTFQTPVPVAAIANTNAPQYPTRVSGQNVSLILQGVFQLDSLMLTYIPNGRR